MRATLPWWVLVTFLAGASAASARVRTASVQYREGQTVLQGYVAYDDAVKGKRPGVLVVHDWLGPGPYVQRRARQLAALGYVAFAADIYGKGNAPRSTAEAPKVSGTFLNNRPLLRRRVRAGLAELRRQPQVDQARVAAIGYCFGGAAVLELARSGADVEGVVAFHGVLSTPTPEGAKSIKGKVLALQGGDDPTVPLSQVEDFVKEMRQGHVNWQVNLYGGAVHAFTIPTAGNNPATGAAYNAQADRRSWYELRLFLQEVFGTKR